MPWNNSEEVWIVDEKDNVVGKADRAVARLYKLPFRVIYIVVRNSKGDIYVQRRSMCKDYNGGLLSPVTSGIVNYGETDDEAAYRELKEEMGISGRTLQRTGKFYYADERGRIWASLYECVYDGDVIFEKAEVDDVFTMSILEILNRPEEFAVDGFLALKHYLAAARC